MELFIFIVVGTLVTAAIWYFFCGVEDEAKKESEEKFGCITCIIIGLISTLVLALIHSL